MTLCNNCGRSWGGLAECHCTVCCNHFTGETAFDKHRKNGKCVEPAKAGLELKKRDVWGGKGSYAPGD